MSRRDRFRVALLAFFLIIGWTLELYFLVHHADLPARARTQLFARGFRLYGLADRGFYDRVTPFVLALEGLNVFVMQPLCALLIYAIARRRAFRWPLQLAIGSYLSLSVLIYYLVGQLSGYEMMREPSAAAFALYYGANLPWLVGYGWLAVDAGLAITHATRTPALRRKWRPALRRKWRAAPRGVPAASRA